LSSRKTFPSPLGPFVCDLIDTVLAHILPPQALIRRYRQPTLPPANCFSARSRSIDLPNKPDYVPLPPSVQTNLQFARAPALTRPASLLSTLPLLPRKNAMNTFTLLQL
jgi:hypothetical protein